MRNFGIFGKVSRSAHGIPNLELDLLAVYLNHTSSEFNANGEIMDWLEPLVSELKKQARLAHTCVSKKVLSSLPALGVCVHISGLEAQYVSEMSSNYLCRQL